VSAETHLLDPDSRKGLGEGASEDAAHDADPLDWLPRLSRAQLRLDLLLRRWFPDGRLPRSLRWLEKATGARVRIERPEVLWRASGVGRPGMIIQLTAPRLGTRLGVGVEIPLAHQIVDRLLGFDRPFAQTRLQITPVEWGIWSCLAHRALDALDSHEGNALDRPGDPGLLGPGDLTLDRVGPDAFDPKDLGSIVTIRWPIQLGGATGAVRLWVPESVVQLRLASPATAIPAERQAGKDPGTSEQPTVGGAHTVPRGELAGAWIAFAGSAALPHGLRRLKVGTVLPLSGTRLIGSARNPSGPVDLVIDLDEQGYRFKIPTRPVADTGGRLLRVEARMHRERRTRDPIDRTKPSRTDMSQPTASQGPSASPAVAPLDVPVTLAVELGRVNLTLAQLADMKPGDVGELGRHSRAPVELTSNGRVVARGELVQIDTDLGVRVTSVFV
jgi:flagellar motor switch/type III secretory pathway protein FliN